MPNFNWASPITAGLLNPMLNSLLAQNPSFNVANNSNPMFYSASTDLPRNYSLHTSSRMTTATTLNHSKAKNADTLVGSPRNSDSRFFPTIVQPLSGPRPEILIESEAFKLNSTVQKMEQSAKEETNDYSLTKKDSKNQKTKPFNRMTSSLNVDKDKSLHIVGNSTLTLSLQSTSKVVSIQPTMVNGGGLLVSRRTDDGHLDVRVVYAREFLLQCSSSPFAVLPPANLSHLVLALNEIVIKFPTRFHPDRQALLDRSRVHFAYGSFQIRELNNK